MNLIVICLDAFARQSVVFDRAFGEGQPTLRIRRAFFTGHRSFPWRFNFDRRGHWHHAPGWHKIPPDQDTLAEILLSRGYFTGLVADTYHMFKPTMNFWRGFATYEFIRRQETDNWRGGTSAMIKDQIKRHTREPFDWPRLAGLVQYLYNVRGRVGEEDYLCARVFRTAARWLEDNSANAPFFLWVDSFDPHEPWDPPHVYADRYFTHGGIDFIYPNNVDATSEEQKRMKALYFGEVTLLGVPCPSVDGENVWPLVTGERDSVRDHIVTGWAVFGSGNAGARASVRDDEWNYVTTVHEEDPQPELYHLPSDREERVNVHAQYPGVAERQRERLEAVVGRPIPAQLNEVCDHPVPSPLSQYLRARYGEEVVTSILDNHSDSEIIEPCHYLDFNHGYPEWIETSQSLERTVRL